MAWPMGFRVWAASPSGKMPDGCRFRVSVCIVASASAMNQTDGEEATDGLEPAWRASAPADTDPGARRRMGEHLPALVSGFPPSRAASQESGLTPRNLPLSVY